MEKLEAAALYAGLSLFLLLALSLVCVFFRFRTKTITGDGGNPDMARIMRVHANAAEYVPAAIAALILAALLEPFSVLHIHLFGGGLLIGRLTHAWGLITNPGRSLGRSVGILLTWLVYIALGAGLILAAFGAPLPG